MAIKTLVSRHWGQVFTFSTKLKSNFYCHFQTGTILVTHLIIVRGQERSNANLIASLRACIFSGFKSVIRSTRRVFGIVVIVSRLMAQLRGKPSEGPSLTSTGIFRIRVVIGAIVTRLRTCYDSSRLNNTTGRRPAGLGSDAHQTSPRFIPSIPLLTGLCLLMI